MYTLAKKLLWDTNLNIDVPLFAEHDGIFQVEVKQNDHLTIARLVEGVLDVVVENVNLKKRI